MAHRPRLSPKDSIAFLQGFLARPKEVASVIPSSRFLERRLTTLAGVGQARVVVELGPGTGGTTAALLAALPPEGRLLAIEINPEFAHRLRERLPDPRLLIWEGSAEHLAQALADHGLARPDAVLSGIPFSTMPPDLGTRILTAIRDNLAPGGCFVAYQFRDHVQRLGTPVLGEAEAISELRNIPPLKIFKWVVGTRPSAP